MGQIRQLKNRKQEAVENYRKFISDNIDTINLDLTRWYKESVGNSTFIEQNTNIVLKRPSEEETFGIRKSVNVEELSHVLGVTRDIVDAGTEKREIKRLAEEKNAKFYSLLKDQYEHAGVPSKQALITANKLEEVARDKLDEICLELGFTGEIPVLGRKK